MYVGTNQSCRVSGDVLSVVERLVDSGKRVLLVTPLLEDKNRLFKEIASPQVEVMRVLEAEKAVAAKEYTPEVVVVHHYPMVRDLGLFPVVNQLGECQLVLLVDRDEPGDDAVQHYPMVYEAKKTALFEVRAPDVLHQLTMVFALTKLRPIRQLAVVVPSERECRRVKAFLDAFGVNCATQPAQAKDTVVGLFIDSLLVHDYALVIDLTGQLGPTKSTLLRLGASTSPNAERFVKLLERAGEYKYRIESVLKLINPQVLSGKKPMDCSGIKHLRGPLKMIRQ